VINEPSSHASFFEDPLDVLTAEMEDEAEAREQQRIAESRDDEPREGENRWLIQTYAAHWGDVCQDLRDEGGYAEPSVDSDIDVVATCTEEDILSLPCGWVFSYRRRK
jgi:hypothetical protein